VEDWEAVQKYRLEQSDDAKSNITKAGALVPDISVSIYDPTASPTPEEGELIGKRKNPLCIQFKIDVVIREVFATSHKRENTTLGTANSAEKDKKKKYLEYERENKCKVVPFGLSSSGEFGDCAMKLVRMITKISKKLNRPILSTHFVERVSLILETARFFMISQYEQQMIRLAMNLPSRSQGSTLYPLLPPPYLCTKQQRHYSHNANSYWKHIHQEFTIPQRFPTPQQSQPPNKRMRISSSSPLPIQLLEFTPEVTGPIPDEQDFTNNKTKKGKRDFKYSHTSLHPLVKYHSSPLSISVTENQDDERLMLEEEERERERREREILSLSKPTKRISSSEIRRRSLTSDKSSSSNSSDSESERFQHRNQRRSRRLPLSPPPGGDSSTEQSSSPIFPPILISTFSPLSSTPPSSTFDFGQPATSLIKNPFTASVATLQTQIPTHPPPSTPTFPTTIPTNYRRFPPPIIHTPPLLQVTAHPPPNFSSIYYPPT
jgi:hypothetical protein